MLRNSAWVIGLHLLSSEQVILGERPQGRLFQGKEKSLVAFFFFLNTKMLERAMSGTGWGESLGMWPCGVSFTRSSAWLGQAPAMSTSKLTEARGC